MSKLFDPQKLVTIAENQQKVYNAGYEKGKTDNYNTFWDKFQNYGKPEGAHYEHAFSYSKFDDTNYNPKYPIICRNHSNAAGSMFYAATITDTKVPIDLTNTTRCVGIFAYCYNLVTINKLIVHEGLTGDMSIPDSARLENVTIEGTIVTNWNIPKAPLTRDSIQSIYNALSTTTTGKTLTLNKTAVNAAFTDDEWRALTDAKSNWTFTLS